MMVGDGEMLSVVAEMVAMGLKCGVLREEQESAATAAAAMLAAKDVRDVIEICSAQLVSKNTPRGSSHRVGGL